MAERFPPPLRSLLPALDRDRWVGPAAGLAAFLALAGAWAALAWLTPAAAPVLLSPASAAGHGLAVGLVIFWWQNRRALKAGRAGLQGLKATPPDPHAWAVVARQRCRDAVKPVPLPDLCKAKYDECRAMWEQELQRGRRSPYLLAAALVLPGTVATLGALTPEAAREARALELALPVLAGTAEALAVAALLLGLEDRWENLLLRWKDAAAERDIMEAPAPPIAAVVRIDEKKAPPRAAGSGATLVAPAVGDDPGPRPGRHVDEPPWQPDPSPAGDAPPNGQTWQEVPPLPGD